MDSQDTLALAEVMEQKDYTMEDYEVSDTVIIFMALKNYLTHLTNNGGTIKRITKVTTMLNDRLSEVQEYLIDKMKES